MTHRERHTPDATSARDPIRLSSAGRSASTSPPPPGEVSLWTDWYHRASPAQQQDALSRAVQQGVLYAHQLAAPVHAAAPPRSLLSHLLNGQVKELQPLHPPVLEYHDRELDRTQREAVARAVATPDVCLIQGFPGTGKSRLVAEILRQAAQRGERILFLAPTSAALDGVLERLGAQAAICPLRCLAADETVSSLPPAIARLTLPERVRFYRESTVPAARAAVAAARQTLEAHQGEQAQWQRLEELAEQAERLAERLRNLSERRAGVVAEVERGEQVSSSFRERWQACARARGEELERLDSQLAGLQAELDTIAGKQAHLDSEWQALRPLVEARQGWRLWTGSWWRAVLSGGLNEQLRDLESRRAEMTAARQRLQQDIAARRDERAEIENRHAAERLRLQEEEIARRQAELDGDIAAATCDQNALREQWRTISPTVCREIAPDEMTRQTVAAGRAAWQRLREDKERQVAAAEQWLQTVEEGVATLPDKLAHCANVIAATTTALAGDEHCGDRDGNPAVLFDLLILEEAHQVTESEFAAAARRARRWVLIGEPQLDAEPADAARPVVRPAVLRAGFFERLWNNLHADPHRLPFAWMRRDGRLLCRLRHISADQEKWIETEPVVDRPDIEVRILSVPRQAPRIVEVIFPAGMDLGDAKRFLFHELEELAVQTRGRAMGWSETPDEVILELASSTETESAAISLAGGVCERLTRLPASQNATAKDGIEWHTCSLAFSRADGWTRPSAEDWIAEHLDLRSPGRTILLTAPYRLDPPLARFLSDLLFDGLCQPAKAETTVSLSRPSVEFVAVPTLAALESRSRAESEGRNQAGAAAALSSERGRGGVSVRAPRLRAVKGGAGLELDLADHRPLEPLPSELRALLPRKGLVNYLEACALVKRLEALVADDDFRSVCAHWLQSRRWPCGHDCMSPTACVCPQPNNAPVVAVIALYPAQVQLLRHLLRQSPVLAGTPLALEVGLPSVFQHRECLLALVSLTRSHTHRAVSYGEHPHALAQALTRASSGLILFGDPGTLARRSQWHGPVDHLDESAARREGHVVGQLVHYLQGHGPHPAAFHVQEGSSV